MSKDLKSSVSGAVAIILAVIQHYFGYDIPDWVTNTIIVPLILASLGHVAWLVGKPGNAEPTPPGPMSQP